MFHTHELRRAMLKAMARYPYVHRDFLVALRVLDATGMPYAMAWRSLRPVAARLGAPRPSYSVVRRILIAERLRKRRHADDLDLILEALFRPRGLLVLAEHKLWGAPIPWRARAAPT